jgi:hypothetical protein
MKLPHIKVNRRGTAAHVTIDGEPFPWFIARSGVRVDVDPDAVPTVTLTILANRVEVDDAIRDDAPEAPTSPLRRLRARLGRLPRAFRRSARLRLVSTGRE